MGAIPEMKLEIYSLKRQEKAFAQLAISVKNTLFKHADEQVGVGRPPGVAAGCRHRR